MIENFIFSVNSVMPLFIVIVVGYFAKERGLLNESLSNGITELVFKIMLPVMLFQKIAYSDFYQIFDIYFVISVVISITVVFLLSWAFAELIITDKSRIGSFVQGAFRLNFAIIALPLTFSVLGDTYGAKCATVTPFVVILLNILSIIVLSVRSNSSEKLPLSTSLKKVGKSILKNPLVIGCATGLLVALIQFQIPIVIKSSINMISSSASPLALLVIGASINFGSLSNNYGLSIIATFIKLVVSPIIFVSIAILFNLDSSTIIMCGIIGASGTATSSYIMAKEMDSDPDLSANVIIFSTLFSTITITLLVYIAKSLSLV